MRHRLGRKSNRRRKFANALFSRFTTASHDRRKFHLKRKSNEEDRGLVHHEVIDL